MMNVPLTRSAFLMPGSCAHPIHGERERIFEVARAERLAGVKPMLDPISDLSEVRHLHGRSGELFDELTVRARAAKTFGVAKPLERALFERLLDDRRPKDEARRVEKSPARGVDRGLAPQLFGIAAQELVRFAFDARVSVRTPRRTARAPPHEGREHCCT